MTDFQVSINRKKVVGVGSALVDILIHESDDFVTRTGAHKGVMTYFEDPVIASVISQATTPPKVVPGGSACNTIVGIAGLGGEAHFIGKCGTDDMGSLLRQSLNQKHVRPHLASCPEPTGKALSIITPDAQRTMLTHLGASAKLAPEDISTDIFKDAGVVQVEGYLLFNPELITWVLSQAKAVGALVSLDLSSANVVEASMGLLTELVSRYVDILIANEDEALAYTQIENERLSALAMAGQVPLAILKTGPRGSLIVQGDKIISIQAKGDGKAIDTTGAGDLWASGFLFGLVQGMPLELCGDLGSLCGFEVCQVVGAAIPEKRWMIINQYVEEKWPKKE